VSEEERFIIAQNGSPSAVGPVCISRLSVSGLVCLDTVSSACSEFDRPTDRPPSFAVVVSSHDQAIGVRGTASPASISSVAGRGGPPAPWPRKGEGGECHQHPPSVEGRLVDKGINWLHHWQVPVLEHYIAAIGYWLLYWEEAYWLAAIYFRGVSYLCKLALRRQSKCFKEYFTFKIGST
jgi:hypothetical protein